MNNTENLALIDEVKAQVINLPLVPQHFVKPFTVEGREYQPGYYAVFINQFADVFIIEQKKPPFESLKKCQVSCIVYNIMFCDMDRRRINALFSLWNVPILMPSLYSDAQAIIREKDAVDTKNANTAQA